MIPHPGCGHCLTTLWADADGAFVGRWATFAHRHSKGRIGQHTGHRERDHIMNATRIIGIVLLVAGAAALAMGTFSYTKETQKGQLGPIALSVDEKRDVNIPTWAGVAVIVVGGALVAVGGKRR